MSVVSSACIMIVTVITMLVSYCPRQYFIKYFILFNFGSSCSTIETMEDHARASKWKDNIGHGQDCD